MFTICTKSFKSLLLLFICALGSGLYLVGEELDRTDPAKVANYVLEAIQIENYVALIDLMPADRQKEYLPLTPEKRQEVEKLFSKDKKKAGKIKQVSEIRKLTTYRGVPGVAAKVSNKNSEVFVIVLSYENNLFYFDDTLNLSPDLFKKLVPYIKDK
jgi:hypothetical protein